jgi:hypothetical protein
MVELKRTEHLNCIDFTRGRHYTDIEFDYGDFVIEIHTMGKPLTEEEWKLAGVKR